MGWHESNLAWGNEGNPPNPRASSQPTNTDSISASHPRVRYSTVATYKGLSGPNESKIGTMPWAIRVPTRPEDVFNLLAFGTSRLGDCDLIAK